MSRLAIRCHPYAPVSADELRDWLSRQVDDLRADSPHAIVRLLRLTQGGPRADLEAGWLLEFELAEDEPPVDGRWLADTLRDMRLLGLQPTLLTPLESGGQENGAFARDQGTTSPRRIA
ncbi:MAG TPA: hypothetical protein VGF25_03880 [Thermoleophilaceae bacterium]